MIPTNHPDLLPLLVAFIRGDSAAILVAADWLEERGDGMRAGEIRVTWHLLTHGCQGETDEYATSDVLKLFNVDECDCVTLDAEPNGCDVCKGLRWVMNKVPLI